MGTQYSKFSDGDVSNRLHNGGVEGSSSQSTIADRAETFFTPPSIRKLQPGKSALKSKTPSSNDENNDINITDYGSSNSNVTHNSAMIFTPASISKLQPGSSVLKCRRSNCYIDENATMFTVPSVSQSQPGSNVLKSKRTKYDNNEKGLISVHASQNRVVLSDITNISHSSEKCLRDLSQVYESDSDMLAKESGIKKRFSFSSQNIDELHSVYSERSVSKKRNRSVLSDITNIRYSSNQYSDKTKVYESSSDVIAKGFVTDCPLSKNLKSTLFEVPIFFGDDINAIDLSLSEKRTPKQKEGRLEHEVDIEYLPRFEQPPNNGFESGSLSTTKRGRVAQRSEVGGAVDINLGNASSSTTRRWRLRQRSEVGGAVNINIGSASLSTRRRRRVSRRSEVGGAVNMNHIEDDDIWNFNLNEYNYDDCGDPEFLCRWCGSRFWLRERLVASSTINPVYTLCCGNGKVELPLMTSPPPYLRSLIWDVNNSKGRHFQDKIRAYNSMFSFTSMGGKIDNSVNDGRGRFSFRLSGQNHHRIGSLLPAQGQKPRFAQLYIVDTANEVDNRMNALRNSRSQSSDDLDPDIMYNLKEMFDEYNPICKVFRMARDCMNLKLKLRMRTNKVLKAVIWMKAMRVMQKSSLKIWMRILQKKMILWSMMRTSKTLSRMLRTMKTFRKMMMTWRINMDMMQISMVDMEVPQAPLQPRMFKHYLLSLSFNFRWRF